MSVVKAVSRVMDRIAPLKLAEKWDNVGLLLEAPFPRPNANRVLLTIDLTTEVAEEALNTPTCCIIAYHPTIFKPLPSLTLAKPLQRTLLRCAAAGISIYSPHTALDSVQDGINDWLAEVCMLTPGDTQSVEKIPASVAYIGEDLEGLGGIGRVVTYNSPISMKTLEANVKHWLKLDHIQVAYPAGYNPEEPVVQSVAVGAGSCGPLVSTSKADVWLTGEMLHHQVLAAVATGHCVILCGHTNTERGYLPRLAKTLLAQLGADAAKASGEESETLRALEVHVSGKDRHPLQIV